MRPSSRFDYALRAMVDLAAHQGSGPVKIASVAKRQAIPHHYLGQLFNRLRRAGLVVAERGPLGGYLLGRPAAQIPVSEIFETLELPSANGRSAKARSKPKGSAQDPTQLLWRQVESVVQTTLKATTLEELASQLSKETPSPKHRYTFHI